MINSAQFLYRKENYFRFYEHGVTVLEMIIVIGILAVLFGLTSISLTKLIPRANTTTLVDTLVADLKQQQQRAMSGETAGNTTSQPLGVHIDSNKYVLYSGSSYSASNAQNSEFPVSEAVQLSTTFSNGTILFEKGSGEINGFSSGNDTITILDTVLNLQRVIQLNKYGVVIAVN